MEEAEGKRYLAAGGCAESELGYYWEDMLRTADANGDGKISREEFLVYVLGEEDLEEGTGKFVDAAYAERLE